MFSKFKEVRDALIKKDTLMSKIRQDELMLELAALKKRIEELEKHPKQEVHYHYLYSCPQHIPQPYYFQPYYQYPQPMHSWTITCGGGMISGTTAFGNTY